MHRSFGYQISELHASEYWTAFRFLLCHGLMVQHLCVPFPFYSERFLTTVDVWRRAQNTLILDHGSTALYRQEIYLMVLTTLGNSLKKGLRQKKSFWYILFGVCSMNTHGMHQMSEVMLYSGGHSRFWLFMDNSRFFTDMIYWFFYVLKMDFYRFLGTQHPFKNL